MKLRVLPILAAFALAACEPAPAPPEQGADKLAGAPEGERETQQLALYPDAAEIRLFYNAQGFAFPDGVSLDHLFDREGGALMGQEERGLASNSVSVGPAPESIPSCLAPYRHAFVFYDGEGAPLGALAVSFACDRALVIGPAAASPAVSADRYRWNAADLRAIADAHGVALAPSP